jgi:hypothetical protein
VPRVIAALFVVTACGSRSREAEPAPTADPTADPTAEVTPAPTPVRPSAPAPRRDDEWPAAPTRVVTDRIGDLAFTLALPNELQGHPNDRTERSRGWEVVGWPLTQPRFEVTRRDEPGFTTVEAGREAYADDADHVASAALTDGPVHADRDQRARDPRGRGLRLGLRRDSGRPRLPRVLRHPRRRAPDRARG